MLLALTRLLALTLLLTLAWLTVGRFLLALLTLLSAALLTPLLAVLLTVAGLLTLLLTLLGTGQLFDLTANFLGLIERLLHGLFGTIVVSTATVVIAGLLAGSIGLQLAQTVAQFVE